MRIIAIAALAGLAFTPAAGASELANWIARDVCVGTNYTLSESALKELTEADHFGGYQLNYETTLSYSRLKSATIFDGGNCKETIRFGMSTQCKTGAVGRIGNVLVFQGWSGYTC